MDSFTRVFGDCYISGFLDGGEFTALINFKMTDEAEDADRRRWEDLYAQLYPGDGTG